MYVCLYVRTNERMNEPQLTYPSCHLIPAYNKVQSNIPSLKQMFLFEVLHI